MKKILLVVLALLLACPTFCLAEAAEVTYTAEAAGFGGTVVVTMTVSDGAITSVTVEGASETPGIGAAALEPLAELILAAQSAEIDGVSGATFTSKAAILAAEECLAQAFGGAEAAEVKLAAGTYNAEAYGFNMGWSDKLVVTVNETGIESIAYGEDCGDTPPMLDTVEKVLFPRIIENQSVSVDSVCGATATSAAVKAAVEDCLKQALAAGGSDEAAIKAFYTVPEKSTASEEIQTQVLVVGMGGSGLYSALRAQESGAQVLVIEKQARYGGTTALTSEIESINPPRIKEKYNNGEDFCDRDAMYQAWLEYVEGDAKVEMIDLYFDQCGPALDWLAIDHEIEFDFDPKVGFTPSDVYKVKFQWMPNTSEKSPGMFGANKAEIAANFDKLVGNFTEAGGQYMLETEGYALILEDGKVVGVKAHNVYDGTEYVIKADAVVLATGGFLGNGEMTTKYLSDEYYPLKGEWKYYGCQGNDGKMVESAIQNGAATYNIGMPPEVHMSGSAEFISAAKYGYPINEIEGRIGAFSGVQSVWTVADLPMFLGISANSMAVGTWGERFASETGIAMLDPWIAGPNYYSIWSTEQIDDIKENGFKLSNDGVAAGFLGHLGAIPTDTPLPEAYDVLNTGIEMGFIFKADTIEELAAQIGMDPAVLAAQVEKYNGYCETGVDEQFGKAAEMLNKIGEGPYYAIKMASYSYCTCAALDVNEQLQVLDTNGNVIDGLFAVGGDSMGVLFSEKKPYVTYGGANNGWALTSGYVAGTTVTDYVNAK